MRVMTTWRPPANVIKEAVMVLILSQTIGDQRTAGLLIDPSPIHNPNNSLSGSWMASFNLTRNWTASRPSTMR